MTPARAIAGATVLRAAIPPLALRGRAAAADAFLVRPIRSAWRRRRVRVTAYCFLAVGASYLALLLAPKPPDDGRPLPTRGGTTAVSRIEPLYSQVASRIAGENVEVRCWSEGDWVELTRDIGDWTKGKLHLGPWSGFATPERNRISLAPTICNSLGRWAYERHWPEGYREAYYFAWSVKALAHETQHARGIENEAETECYAVQTMTEVGVELGFGEERARNLAEYAWHYVYPRGDDEYRSDECHDGGALDLNPESSVWP
jgi:hypothetical protein